MSLKTSGESADDRSLIEESKRVFGSQKILLRIIIGGPKKRNYLKIYQHKGKSDHRVQGNKDAYKHV